MLRREEWATLATFSVEIDEILHQVLPVIPAWAEKTSQRPQIELLAGFRGLAWSRRDTEEPVSMQERSLMPPTDLEALGPEPADLAIAACSGLRLHV
jgi:hypothetical protein